MTEVRLQATVQLQRGALQLSAQLHTDGTLLLIGPNGSGKSTLLLALLGLLPADSLRLQVDGEALDRVDVAARRIAYVPQGYGLMPHLDVRGNLAFAEACQPRALRQVGAVDAALRDFGLSAIAGRAVAALSGGERQRLALARALLMRPRALLLDEPFAALDLHHREAMRALLAERLRQWRLPAIVVSHDPADVATLADDVLVLESGRVSQHGARDDVLANPATAFVRAWAQALGRGTDGGGGGAGHGGGVKPCVHDDG